MNPERNAQKNVQRAAALFVILFPMLVTLTSCAGKRRNETFTQDKETISRCF